MDKQTDATLSKNVKFDAYFVDEAGKTHYKLADVNNDQVKIHLQLEVQNDGYLKNAVVVLDGEDEEQKLNYELESINDETGMVQKQGENSVSLRQINKNEKVDLDLNVIPKNNKTMSEKEINQNSKVKINAMYMDGEGKETPIQKDVTINLGWTGEYEVQNDVNVVKYIPVNIGDTKKVLVQYSIKTGLKEQKNMLPVKQTEVIMQIPEFDGVKPERIDVTAKTTEATNGRTEEDVKFTKDNWTQTAEGKEIKINIVNKEDGKITLGKGQDEYLITYVYPQESDNQKNVSLETSVKTKMTIYNSGESKEFVKEDEKTITLKEPIGKLLSLDGNNKTDAIGKGKMYANVTSEEKSNQTEYEIVWNINVGYKDTLEKIKMQDEQTKIVNAYGTEEDISKYTTYKTITISKESFMQVLGDEGTIKILDEKGIMIGIVNKATKIDENGDFIITFTAEIPRIILETSKPVQEGNLVITSKKAITGKLNASKSQIESYNNLMVINSLSQKEKETEEYLKTEEKAISIPFEETTTKARLTMSRERLSTIVNNENVEFKIELGNNTDNSDLYMDPRFDIEFPSYVEDINIKDYKILYDDELEIKYVQKLQSDNGNLLLRVQLDGLQTKFSTGTITNGTNIVLSTDIKVNILTPSADDEIKMYYYNINTKNYENLVQTKDGKAGLTTLPVSFAAPIGLISVSNWQGFDDTARQVMSVNQGKTTEQIGIYRPTTLSKMYVILMNNTGNMCNDISVLGRIPFKGNKSVLEGEDLGTTQDTYLRSYIVPEKLETNKIKIYYSENGEATRDLTNPNNGWVEQVEDFTKIKSFLIVGNDYELEPEKLIGFSYYVELQDKMSYNNDINFNFATYYTENAPEASLRRESESDVIGLTTGKGPDLKITQEVTGADENGNIKEKGLLKYKVTVVNEGTEVAQNVVIKDELPKWTSYVRSSFVKNTSYMNVESYPQYEENISRATMNEWNVVDNGDAEKGIAPKLQWNIATLAPGESVTREFEVLTWEAPNIYEYYKDYPGFIAGEDGKYYITTQKYDVNTDSTVETKNEITSVPEIEIKNMATVTAGNFAIELKATEGSVALKESDLEVNENRADQGADIVEQGTETGYAISVINTSETEKQNVVVEKILPAGVTFKEAYLVEEDEEGNRTQQKLTYDEQTRKIVGSKNTLGSYKSFLVQIKVTIDRLEQGVYEKEIRSNSKVSADGYEPVTTNDLVFTVEKPQLQITQKCNTNNKYLNEGDTVEYTVTVENIGKIEANEVEVSQYIPEELKFVKASYVMYGRESGVRPNALNEVNVYGSLEPGESIVLTVTTTVKALEDDTAINAEASVSCDKGDYIKAEEIEQVIEKSTKTNTNPKDEGKEPTNGKDPSGTPTEKTYKISGYVWIDEDENGKRDSKEELVKDIRVIAIDTLTGNIAKNASGEDARATTNSVGAYVIDNLKKGNYIVAFYYDTSIYTVTKYKASGISDVQNSDAIERKITQNGEESIAGVTDTISLQRSVSNIDIGLTTREKFDLKLEKSVVKVSSQNKEGTKTYPCDNAKLAQIPITGKQLDNSTIVIEYRIKITNEGTLDGFAKNIVDYIPKELTFNSELNPEWYLGNDGNLYTTQLANKAIPAGGNAEISLVLTKKLSENSTGLINNNAEIKESYNEYGLKDRDSNPGNKTQGEDDQDSADVLITVKTGGEFVAISIVIVFVLILLAIGIYIIREKITINR